MLVTVFGAHRRIARLVPGLVVVLLLTGGTAVAGAASFLTPAWTTYHRTGTRQGFDPDSSQPVAPSTGWHSAALDGAIYGQPLVLGSRVFVATENNTVYALNATTGAVLWHRNAGTPVPGSALPCGDVDPVGITSTPVLDPYTNGIYAVADVYSSGQIRHELVAYGIATGAPLFSPMVVDVGGGTNPEFVPANQLQRAGLALDGRRIVIGFGGNDGDCAHYHGWLVAVNDTGTGSPLSYQVGPNSDDGGAIWGGGGGPAVDSDGAIFATTGNGFSTSSYDHGDSVIKLGPSLDELDHYAPSTWASDNGSDLDLGSDNAMLLPGGLLFQSGKNGKGYLVRRATGQMGGTGVAGQPDPSAYHAAVCSPGSWGGSAYDGGRIFVPCGYPGGGGSSVKALSYNSTKPSFTYLWSGPSGASSPPIVAGGLVWLVSLRDDALYGLNMSTGAVAFTAPLSGPEHFTSPSAGGGRLFVADGNVVRSFVIAQLPKPVVKITSPPNGATETSSPITVKGTVSDTVDIASVTVNGIKATLTGGVWSASVPLTSGQNTITAKATDGAGETAAASITVTYTPS
jgi:outer membrane protein assembly factor BamB